MSDDGIAKVFGLRRSNYILNPQADSSFYATRTGFPLAQVVESLQVDLATQLPPKRLFWGLYGGGKTHTLFHIAGQLEKLTPIRTMYVECPNFVKRSTFIHLFHDGIMASIGQDLTVKLFRDLLESVVFEGKTMGREAILARLKSVIGDENLSRAVASLISDEPAKKLLFWRYISGVPVPAADLRVLEQTQDLTQAEPSKLAEVITIIGRVVKIVEKKTLVLILDELDRLRFVGDEAGSSFQNAFRKLLDDNQCDVAILLGASAGGLEELPEVFGGPHGPVLSRLSKPNLIEIQQIDPKDVDNFIKEVIAFVRDPSKPVEPLITELQKETKDRLDPAFFPFSKEAIEALKGTLMGIMTPREVTQRMTHAAGRAYLMKKKVITREVIA